MLTRTLSGTFLYAAVEMYKKNYCNVTLADNWERAIEYIHTHECACLIGLEIA